MLDLVINIDQDTYDKLDKLDQDALEAWHKNYNNFKMRQGERRDQYQQKVDLERIVNLYKVYGTSQNAIVHQVNNPTMLTVKPRKEATEKQLLQLAKITQNKSIDSIEVQSNNNLASARSNISVRMAPPSDRKPKLDA
jgi:hypothetical protein